MKTRYLVRVHPTHGPSLQLDLASSRPKALAEAKKWVKDARLEKDNPRTPRAEVISEQADGRTVLLYLVVRHPTGKVTVTDIPATAEARRA
jgi:hypothetical protein